MLVSVKPATLNSIMKCDIYLHLHSNTDCVLSGGSNKFAIINGRFRSQVWHHPNEVKLIAPQHAGGSTFQQIKCGLATKYKKILVACLLQVLLIHLLNFTVPAIIVHQNCKSTMS